MADLADRLLALRKERQRFNQQTDIFGALTEVARLQPDTTVSGSTLDALVSGEEHYQYEQVICIFSDMIHECSRFDFSRSYTESYGRRVLGELIDGKEIPRLTKAKVIIHGRTGKNRAQVDELLSFWNDFFKAAGAELVAYEYDARARIRELMVSAE